MNRPNSKRLSKELNLLQTELPADIVCTPKGERIDSYEARMEGPPDTPYENGYFYVDINLSSLYPIEPPSMAFKTRIYHPNIDDHGQICLEVLKKGKNGGWSPSWTLDKVLISLKVLLANPNEDDPLMSEIADQMRSDHATPESPLLSSVLVSSSMSLEGHSVPETALDPILETLPEPAFDINSVKPLILATESESESGPESKSNYKTKNKTKSSSASDSRTQKIPQSPPKVADSASIPDPYKKSTASDKGKGKAVDFGTSQPKTVSGTRIGSEQVLYESHFGPLDLGLPPIRVSAQRGLMRRKKS
ncbi:hypothetical protein IW150_000365 [Coemansia sp. RSA 2607]|nr:hypothetical protein IW150_000365 [Coemansia sp. RSA 2607]